MIPCTLCGGPCITDAAWAVRGRCADCRATTTPEPSHEQEDALLILSLAYPDRLMIEAGAPRGAGTLRVTCFVGEEPARHVIIDRAGTVYEIEEV